MIHYLCVFYSIIIVIFDSHFVFSDLTLVFESTDNKSYNASCVIENTSQKPIFWQNKKGIPLASPSTSRYIPKYSQINFDEEKDYSDWTVNKWKIGDSYTNAFEPVTDERWELFQTKRQKEMKIWNEKENGNFVSISLSVFLSNMEYRLIIGDKYYVEISSSAITVSRKNTFERLPNISLKPTDDGWLHFTLSKTENFMNIACVPNQKPIEWSIGRSDYSKDIKITPGPSNKTNGFWKLHKYKYLYSEDMEETTQPIGTVIYHTGKVCITMFGAVCDSCTLNIKIKVDGITIRASFNITTEENGNDHYIWKRIVINENIDVLHRIELFVRKLNSKNSRGFWAIDDIRLCTSEEMRVSSIYGYGKNNIKCSLVGTNFSASRSTKVSEDVTCPIGQIGPACNISCQSIFKKNNYCGNTICTSTGCSCSWGFQGENCNKACEAGFWGVNCINACGHCKSDTCNTFNGSCINGCEKTYTGPQCAGQLPLFINPPTVENKSHTEITIRIYSEYKGSMQPKEILIQYRKENEIRWTKSSTVNYRSNYTVTHIVHGLEPATKYDIGVVLLTDEVLLDENIVTITVTTTCEDITEEDLEIHPDTISANVTWKNMTSTTACRPDLYTLELLRNNSSNIRLGRNRIMDLSPYTTYTIKLFNNLTKKRMEKTFRTNPTEPGKVSDAKWEKISSENITVVWKRPKTNGESISYIIKYTLIGHKACGANYSQELQDKFFQIVIEEHQTEKIVLLNLTAYSYYNISIQASNVAGKGKETFITVATESDYLSNTELPTTARIENGRIHITPPSCNNIQGPLNYYINFTYNDNVSCINNPKPFLTKIKYGETSIKCPETLVPNANYLITIGAQRNEKTRLEYEPKLEYKSKPSKPPKVRNLIVYSKNESHVWLRWFAPCPANGELQKYIINVFNTNINPHTTLDFPSNTKEPPCLWEDENCATITNLRKNENYKFEVQAINRDVVDYGEVASINGITKQEESEPPNNLSHKFEAGELILDWIHPIVTNGPLQQFKIEGYVVDSQLEDSAQNISVEYNIQRDQLHYNKKINATPATLYNISVLAINNHRGKPASIEVVIPPPKPELSLSPFFSSCSDGTCSVHIPPAKTCVNCSFYIVVTTEEKGPITSPIQNNVFNKKVFNDTEILQYHSWNETKNKQTLLIGTSQGERAVNNNSYYVTSVILLSSYKGKYVSETYRLDYGIEESSVSVLYYLLVLLIIPPGVLLYFIYRFRRKNKDESSKETEHNDAPPPLMKSRIISVPEDSVPLMILPPKPSIQPKPSIIKEAKHKYSKVIELSNLKSYLKEAAEGDTNLSQLSLQHEMCRAGYEKPVEIGSMEINKKKNRYKDLIAYDHTRVKLKCTDENGSDYINANYIDGYNTKKAYIATQGPKVSTVNDFWYMIWEQNVSNIVMLANVIENGKKKCEEYWPAFNQIRVFKDISVQNIDSNVFSSYILRELQVTYKGNTRIINHLHFTLWPDHGVPLYAQNLVPFMKEMLRIPQGKHPIVVHCSAGIGRTGTILLCDIVLRMAALEQKVDFLKIYHQLREQRPKMVDNPAQYILAHLVVYECLFGKDFSVPLDNNFKKRIEDLLSEASIKSMMDYLDEVSWQIKIMQEYFHNELLDINKRKNRFPTILPGCSQIYLERYPQDDEGSDYINAVSMDCFQNQNRFIVTQQPLPNTVGDFWRLILQYDVNTIISLNEIYQKYSTSCFFWPGQNESFYPVDYIKVACVNEEDRGDFNLVTIALTDENENERRFINLICLNGWLPEKAVPPDLNGILALREHMFNTTFRQENPIVITCYDGAKASGLFAALSFLIEKMKLEQSCDVVLAVSTVRQKRIQCFRNKEQFKFLLKAALLYFDSFDTYANFENL